MGVAEVGKWEGNDKVGDFVGVAVASRLCVCWSLRKRAFRQHPSIVQIKNVSRGEQKNGSRLKVKNVLELTSDDQEKLTKIRQFMQEQVDELTQEVAQL